MDKQQLELYTDYLISNYGYATATGLSAMTKGEVSHDKVTRFLSEREYTSKDLWLAVKSAVRQMEGDDGVLIFDDTISEKRWTDENEVVCWHYEHTKGRLVKGINLLNALYHNRDVSLPVAFEVIVKRTGSTGAMSGSIACHYRRSRRCAAGSKAMEKKCFWCGRFYKQGRQHRRIESGMQRSDPRWRTGNGDLSQTVERGSVS